MSWELSYVQGVTFGSALALLITLLNGQQVEGFEKRNECFVVNKTVVDLIFD